MKKIICVSVLCVSLGLAGCSNYQMSKGQAGAGMGAAAGALAGQAIGGDTEATLIGAALGGVLGYVVGNEMDKADRQELNNVYETGYSGQTSEWSNPDNGNQYQVTPEPAYTPANSAGHCRQAEIVAVIDGKTEKTYTTACRDEYGQWQLQGN